MVAGGLNGMTFGTAAGSIDEVGTSWYVRDKAMDEGRGVRHE